MAVHVSAVSVHAISTFNGSMQYVKYALAYVSFPSDWSRSGNLTLLLGSIPNAFANLTYGSWHASIPRSGWIFNAKWISFECNVSMNFIWSGNNVLLNVFRS